MSTQNLTLIFKKVPEGFPVAGEHLTVESKPLDTSSAPENGVIVENLYASFDPYMRGRMRAPETKSYAPPFDLGEPVYGRTLGRVLKSNNSKYKEGVLVTTMSGPFQEYSSLAGKDLDQVVVLENPLGLEDIRVFIGALGMPGLTAYSSLYEIGKPKKGETIFISAASGAVGQLVGQLAKHEGLKVIGSVGSDDKLKYIIDELGFDGGFNYKKEKPSEALERLCPDGIDIYYENVGGEQLEAALVKMNNWGRIVACGMISQYNLPLEKQYGVKGLMSIVAKRLDFRGFIVSDPDFAPKWHKEHVKNVSKWLKEGSFKALMSETDGMENAAKGLVGIFHGENFGKAVLKIKK